MKTHTYIIYYFSACVGFSGNSYTPLRCRFIRIWRRLRMGRGTLSALEAGLPFWRFSLIVIIILWGLMIMRCETFKFFIFYSTRLALFRWLCMFFFVLLKHRVYVFFSSGLIFCLSLKFWYFFHVVHKYFFRWIFTLILLKIKTSKHRLF